MKLKSPEQPTFYFIGVTTSSSSIMRIFPIWMKALGLPDVEILGYDIQPDGPRQKYRTILEHIKKEEQAKGALVTTHKIAIVREAGDLFDRLDRYADIFGEVSSISKQEGMLVGHAKDPYTSGLAMDAFAVSVAVGTSFCQFYTVWDAREVWAEALRLNTRKKEAITNRRE